MRKRYKFATAFLLLILASMILMTLVYAQEEIPPEPLPPPRLPLPGPTETIAYVTVLAAVGGTTDPVPGQYPYGQGEWFNITAIPYEGYRFLYWTISGEYLPGHNLPPITYPSPIPEDFVPNFPDPRTAGWDSLVTSQNPLNVICGYGYNFQYQPVFTPISTMGPGVEETIVVMLQALGGSTDPSPGTYIYASGQGLTIEATADEGYAFDYWIATGSGDAPDTVIVDNPADISCQEGYTYTYQPVFVPHGAETQPSGTPVEYFYAAIIILAIIAVVGIAAALMYRSRGGAK